MKLSDISIRRPVFASMVSLALVLFGAIASLRLSVREYPDIDPPIVSVSTFLPGANPRVVESAVTDVLEEELSTVEGLRTLTSSSGEQFSNITLEFNLDREVEGAAQDVRDKVARVRGQLPREVEEPVVAKEEADAQPFYWLALRGENYTLLELTDIADRVVKTRLQTLPGVGQAQIFGERRFSIRIWLSPEALASRGLAVQDVEAAIRSRSSEIPAGRIESEQREFTIRSLGELKTAEEYERLVVASQGGSLVRLGDVARVELAPRELRSSLRYNGATSIAVGVIRQSKSNLIQVSDAIQAEIPAIEEALPPGVTLETAFDQSVFVRRSIRETIETLLLSCALVTVIIFVFLRNFRATVVPVVAIPVSIISTFAVMAALGYSINTFTLLAMILAIGIVVDDAIIVLENAYRHQEELGEDPETAAIRGSHEIGFAVIATTISLVAVFSPLAFLTGATGRLFNEFGITLAAAVLFSGFVALTLSPMLCAKVLRVPKSHGALFQSFERGFDSLASSYRGVLAWAVRNRPVVLAGAAVTLVIAALSFRTLEREFLPEEDRGWALVITVAPEGSTLEYTDSYQRQIEAILAETPEVEGYFQVVGFGGNVAQGFTFVRFTDWEERERPAQAIIQELSGRFFGLSGVFAFAFSPSPVGGFGNPVQFVVRHPDFDSLVAGMGRLAARAYQMPSLVNVDFDLKINKPELTLAYDRDRMEDLGVAVQDVGATLETMMGGREVNTYTQANKLYDVVVQVDPRDRATPSDLSRLYVRGREGQLVQLDAVARVTEATGPQALPHFNRLRSFTLSAGLGQGFVLGQAVDSLTAVAAEVLPPGSSVALAGESRELEESGGTLYFAFVLALVVVFMVLAAQFESLLHPFTVLLAVPLAVTGALLTLLVFGSTLNLYSQIGFILLIGLAAKNSILLVEYTNQLRDRGMELVEAVLEAGRIRFRPILMTAVATVVGALPIALGLGAGSSSRRPLGLVIVGGVTVATFLTLVLVPVVYCIVEGARQRVLGRRALRASVDTAAESA
jgi:multidrug efflux pump